MIDNEELNLWWDDICRRIAKYAITPIVYAPYRPVQFVISLPAIEPADRIGFVALDFPKLRNFDSTPIGATVSDPDVLSAETEEVARAHDDHFWPHRKGCPTCGSDAYVGFVRVECSNGGCTNFVHRPGM